MNLLMIALTCYGNSSIAKAEPIKFFPENRASKSYSEIKFFKMPGFKDESPAETLFASPEEWFASLVEEKMKSVRLYWLPTPNPTTPDRYTSAFMHGGGQWIIEVLREDNKSELWCDRTAMGNRSAEDGRISLGRFMKYHTDPRGDDDRSSLEACLSELRTSLIDIREISDLHTSGEFTSYFQDIIDSLNDEQDIPKDDGYYAPEGFLSQIALLLICTSTRSWVFRGMGSWNEVSKQPENKAEYERVSERLFLAINEAVAVAATSCDRF